VALISGIASADHTEETSARKATQYAVTLGKPAIAVLYFRPPGTPKPFS